MQSGLIVDGGYVAKSSVRILVVDDYEPFRRTIVSLLHQQTDMEVINEAADGQEAVLKAAMLQPDLVLLDIGLPKLNGIEAARKIREVSSKSKILFVSQESSVDLVQVALALGASGYVLKTDAGNELLSAINTVLRGEEFVGRRFEGLDFKVPSGKKGLKDVGRSGISELNEKDTARNRHDVCFYSDEQHFLDELTRFNAAALKAGRVVIALLTESHRQELVVRLERLGADISSALKQGRCRLHDAAETLSTFMVKGLPDPDRFLKVTGDLIMDAATAAQGQTRIAACGECAPLLWSHGNSDGALQVEHLWDAIAKTHEVDVLCGYALESFQGGAGSHIFEKVCAAHSTVYSR